MPKSVVFLWEVCTVTRIGRVWDVLLVTVDGFGRLTRESCRKRSLYCHTDRASLGCDHRGEWVGGWVGGWWGYNWGGGGSANREPDHMYVAAIKSLPSQSASKFVLQAFLHAVSSCCLSVLAHALLAVLRTLAPTRICRCVVDVTLLNQVHCCLGERYVCFAAKRLIGLIPELVTVLK